MHISARIAAATVAMALLTALAATGVAASRLYRDAPPPRHTGGFGEPTCAACHFDNPFDDGVGEVRISGFPDEYEPGEKYRITIEVRRPGLALGGFQAAIRHASGAQTGRPAGEMRAVDDRVAVVEPDSVSYLQHTLAGTTLEDGVARWTFEWTAPLHKVGGDVVLNAAANAANGDNSEFGDYIYLAAILSRAPR
jgi:hypothetical protein